MNQTERLGRERTHAEQYTHLGALLRRCNRLAGPESRLSEGAKVELRNASAEIVKERNDLWDAIQFRVPDDCEGI